MSLHAFNDGRIVSATPKLLATGSNDILAISALTASPPGKEVYITEIFVANADSSARTLLLTKFDGTNTYTLIPTKSIALNDTLQITFPFVLLPGWTLRGTPSADNVLTVHVTYIETMRR